LARLAVPICTRAAIHLIGRIVSLRSAYRLATRWLQGSFGVAATGFRRSLMAKSLWYRDIRLN
jgi:hypothetical protein